MSKRMLVLMCSIFLIVPLLFMGCGNDGAAGANGSNGSNGTNAPTTGTIAGTVTDAVKLDGIAGVTVTAKDSGGVVKGTATTDATGAYSLASLPLGTVTVYFEQTYYTSPGGMTVGVLGGQTVTINAALSEAAAGGPSVSITGYNNGMYTTDDIGYGGTAALAASGNDPNGDTPTYAWSNATAPALGSVSGSGTSGTVTFPTLAQAMATRADVPNNGTISGYAYLSGRFGILPIISDTRGAVSSKVTVSDGRGKTASVTLALNAASVLTGARNVPRGARVYMNRGTDNASQTWAITAKPVGSAAALDNASSRTPSFVADVSGKYTLAVAALSKTITINAGTWTGIIDSAGATATGYTVGQEGACRTCHDGAIAVNEFDDWYATAHAKIFTLGITGGSGTTGISCAPCHTVGFDRGTNNGGFDDLASSMGWIFPTRNATAWTSMVTNYPTVAKLANIQCENCHGPQASLGHMSTGPLGAIDNNNTFASDRISYSAELCATCHASGTGHNLYSQWASSGHANASLAARGVPSAGTTTNSCARCHSAQGFTIYADQLKAGNIGYIDNTTSPTYFSSVTLGNVEPQTCTACHDPHDVTNPNQLRLFDNVTLLPSGFGIRTFGKGAICTACHNTRNGVYMDNTGTVTSNTTAFLHEDGQTNGTPFAITGHDHTQADVFAGRNAYFMGGGLPMISKHAAVEDTCVGCHMALNPTTHLSHGTPAVDGHRFGINTTNMATYCGNCHGAGTVNGEAIQASAQAGLDSAKASMGTAMLAFLRSGTIDNIVIVGQNYLDNGTRVGTSTSSVTVNTAGAGITGVRYTSGATFEFTIPAQTYKVRASLFKGSATANPAMSVKWNGGATGFDTSSIIYKACWNVVMITNDFSLGIHNPTFVQQVLNNTKWNLDQYGPVAAP